MTILGIDTSLRSTGVGIISFEAGGRVAPVAYDVIRNPATRPLSACLANLHSTLANIIAEFRPDVAAVEAIFFAKFANSAMMLGHARGVAILACREAALDIFEYEPRRVKQALVGYGAAAKAQMQQMIVSQLNLPKTPPEDAADALAIAICHVHNALKLKVGGAKQL